MFLNATMDMKWIIHRIIHISNVCTNLNKFKKTTIISSIFSDHDGINTRKQSQEKNYKIHKHMEAK